MQELKYLIFQIFMRKAHHDEEMQKGYKAKSTLDIGYMAVGALISVDFEKEFLSKLELFGSQKKFLI